MSDTMLHGILQMPPRLWSNDAIDIAQRHGRYLEASERIMELERERDEARRELDLVSDKLCKSESAYLKNEEIIDGLKNEIEHTETFFREKLSRAADDVNEAKRERDEAISKLKFAQNELFTILRFQEDEKREHRNLLERLSFFQNRFESMRAERDQAMSDLKELREEQKEEA